MCIKLRPRPLLSLHTGRRAKAIRTDALLVVHTERRDSVTEHISTRKKLTDIATITEFKQILDLIVLTDDERKLMELHYLQGKSFTQIAMILGYADVTVCKKHKKILKRITKVLT